MRKEPVLLCLLLFSVGFNAHTMGQSSYPDNTDQYDRAVAAQTASVNKLDLYIDASIKSATWTGIDNGSTIVVIRREPKILKDFFLLFQNVQGDSWEQKAVKHDGNFDKVLRYELQSLGYQNAKDRPDY
jgi:hypothetical protein